ncbi:PQQ-binding-like beta-propeller repeat protein [Candidatus Latescibacterota bacterium]
MKKIHIFMFVLTSFLCCIYDAHAASPTLTWKFSAQGGYAASSPAIGSDGTIYFGSSNGNLYAVTPDGTERWQFETDGAVDDSPAIGRDGTIYFGSFDTYIYAVDPDGKLKWRFKTDGLIRSTPAITGDGTVIVGSYDGYLYAFNPDGTLQWNFKAGDGIPTSAALDVDGTIYFGAKDGYLYACNSDGTIKWKYKTGSEIHWSSPSIGSDGTVYIGSFDSYLYAVNPGGTLKWKYKTGAKIGSSPAIGSDGIVYVESCDSYFYAFDSTGELLWKYDVGNTDFGCHPLIGADGTIYIGSNDKSLYALTPGGALAWKFQTGGSLWTTGPTISDNGIIYCVSSDGKLNAIDSGTNAGIASTPWPKFHKNTSNNGLAGTFTVTPSMLKYLDVATGTTALDSISITNYGAETLEIINIAIDNTSFSVNTESISIPPSATESIIISFSPVNKDELLASLSLETSNQITKIMLSGNPPPEPVPVNVKIITRDKDTGELIPCRIFMTDATGKYVLPGRTVNDDTKMFFISEGEIEFPQYSGSYMISIARGNEYIPLHNEAVRIPAEEGQFVIERELERWVHMKELGWYSCDNQVNNYDKRTPATLFPYQLAEDINILHLICMGSYSTTYNYEFFLKGPYSHSKPYYLMTVGEEWRSRTWQNHMVLMNHSQPVTFWGNGYYDGTSPFPYSYPPALDACIETRNAGGIVVQTHPFWYEPFSNMEATYVNRNLAFELPANVAMGLCDGMQIYMYWQYDEWNRYVWYRFLNCGFQIAPFAGTDALLNNPSAKMGVMDPLAGRVRSYAYVPGQVNGLNYDSWIDASVEGSSFVSSGAVLFFTVNGEIPGSELQLDSSSGTARVTAGIDARWIGGLERLILTVNGETVLDRSLQGSEFVIAHDIELTESSWITCRIEGAQFDEFEGDAHSAPIYIKLNDQPIHSPEDADYFAEWIDKHIALLDSADHFENSAQKERTFKLYRDAQAVYEKLAALDPTWVEPATAQQFKLFPASPNPFNSSTIIQYHLPQECRVKLEVYDILGREVAILDDRVVPAGTHKAVWNGTDSAQKHVGSGVYLYRLDTEAFTGYGKFTLLR